MAVAVSPSPDSSPSLSSHGWPSLTSAPALSHPGPTRQASPSHQLPSLLGHWRHATRCQVPSTHSHTHSLTHSLTHTLTHSLSQGGETAISFCGNDPSQPSSQPACWSAGLLVCWCSVAQQRRVISYKCFTAVSMAMTLPSVSHPHWCVCASTSLPWELPPPPPPPPPPSSLSLSHSLSPSSLTLSLPPSLPPCFRLLAWSVVQ